MRKKALFLKRRRTSPSLSKKETSSLGSARAGPVRGVFFSLSLKNLYGGLLLTSRLFHRSLALHSSRLILSERAGAFVEKSSGLFSFFFLFPSLSYFLFSY